jgi:dTDP-4-dehydrorhamnose 3,5-epimerase
MSPRVTPTELPDVVLIEPRVFRDPRGYFLETWNRERYVAAGVAAEFVQDNLSVSAAGVLRGLHLQWPTAQAKLVAVMVGSVFDVAVDVRVGSPTFGRWVGVELSDEGHRQLYIPEGFAHGFVVLRGPATVCYKVNAPYTPADELTVAWDDPDLAIPWPVAAPVLSAKDSEGLRLRDIPESRLPLFNGTNPRR